MKVESDTDFANSYADARRAEAYARLEFPGTYYLAYRDLPAIIAEHVRGTRALDFGCGTGRSTRFLRQLGFDATGVDIAAEMIRRAVQLDPSGDYRRIEDGDFASLQTHAYDLVLSAFTFDNIPTARRKVSLFHGLRDLLRREGRIINLVSAPEIYTHEWSSFSTRAFPENRQARCGDSVRIVVTDMADPRPVEDIIWPDDAYREVYHRAGLGLVATHRPLARQDEPFPWVNETRIPPWVIYVLKAVAMSGDGPRSPE
jgi:SAM-dependent methyltransferase